MINIRDISIKCGVCGEYQTLCRFERREGWNVYSYECEDGPCRPEATRTVVEVPEDLDAFARRDPEWQGGARHGGAHHGGDAARRREHEPE